MLGPLQAPNKSTGGLSEVGNGHSLTITVDNRPFSLPTLFAASPDLSADPQSTLILQLNCLSSPAFRFVAHALSPAFEVRPPFHPFTFPLPFTLSTFVLAQLLPLVTH